MFLAAIPGMIAGMGSAVAGMSAGTMGLISAGMGAASTLAGSMGNAQSMKAQAAMASQNANTERENAARKRLDAASAEEALRRDTRKGMGRAFAALAQSGGGQGLLVEQMSTDAELDALAIRHSGESDAYASLVNASSLDASASNLKAQAKSEMLAGVLGAGGRMLAGVGEYQTWKTSQAGGGAGVNTSPIVVGRRRGGPVPTQMPARDRNSMGGRG